MRWRVRFERRALKELSKIPRQDQARISKFIHERLLVRENPREIGEPLAGNLSGYWKYRVGDFRLIAMIEDMEITITIIRIGNRREIYR